MVHLKLTERLNEFYFTFLFIRLKFLEYIIITKMFEKLILTKTAATFVGTGALEMEFAGAFGLPEK